MSLWLLRMLLAVVTWVAVIVECQGTILVGDASDEDLANIYLYSVDLSVAQPTPSVFYTEPWVGSYFGACADYELSQVFLLRAAEPGFSPNFELFVDTVSYPSGLVLRSNGTFWMSGDYRVSSVQCDSTWHKMVVSITDKKTFSHYTLDPSSGTWSKILEEQHAVCADMWQSTYNSVLHTLSYPETLRLCNVGLKEVLPPVAIPEFTEVTISNASMKTKDSFPGNIVDYSALPTSDNIFYGVEATDHFTLNLFKIDQSGQEELVQNSSVLVAYFWERTGTATSTSFFMLAATDENSTAQVFSWDISSGACASTAPLGFYNPFLRFFNVIQP